MFRVCVAVRFETGWTIQLSQMCCYYFHDGLSILCTEFNILIHIIYYILPHFQLPFLTLIDRLKKLNLLFKKLGKVKACELVEDFCDSNEIYIFEKLQFHPRDKTITNAHQRSVGWRVNSHPSVTPIDRAGSRILMSSVREPARSVHLFSHYINPFEDIPAPTNVRS